MKVTAAGTLWVKPAHFGSMATTTTDDILMVYGDGAEGVFETQQTCVRTSQALPVRRMLDGGTQCMCVSAAIEQRSDGELACGTQRIVLSADGVGEQDSAADS